MIPEFIKSKTDIQLKIYYKQTKNVLIGLILFLSLLVGYAIYGLLTKDNNPVNISILFVSLFCFAALPHQFKLMNKIKKEIAIREHSKK